MGCRCDSGCCHFGPPAYYSIPFYAPWPLFFMCKCYVHAPAMPPSTCMHPSAAGNQHIGHLNKVSLRVSPTNLSFIEIKKKSAMHIHYIYIYMYKNVSRRVECWIGTACCKRKGALHLQATLVFFCFSLFLLRTSPEREIYQGLM